MQKLQERGIAIYRTDQTKTIISTSDGRYIIFDTKPGNYNYGNNEEAYVRFLKAAEKCVPTLKTSN